MEVKMNRKKLLKSKRRGSAMALMMVALVVLLVTGVGLLSLGLHGRILALRNASDIAAGCAADVGLTKALFEMNEKLKVKPWDDSTLPQATNEVLPNCDATFSYTVTVNSSGAGDGESQGGSGESQGGSGESQEGSGESQEGGGDSIYSIESIGNYGRAQRKVRSTLRLESLLDYGIFTQGTIWLRMGTMIDAYNLDAGETLKIGTNSTDAGAIIAHLGVTINGDVVVGSGGDPSVVINSLNEATITGDVYSAGEYYEMPSVTVPEAIQALPSQGTLSGSPVITGSAKYDSINLGLGNIVTIDGAVTLYVTGNVTLNNSAQLQVVDSKTNPDASLTLYLGGNLLTQNGGLINNLTQKPKRLEVFGLDSCTAIDFKSSSVFYGTIYAPNADVHLFNSVEFYGAVIADSFMQDVAANFHYDASLRDATVNDETVRFVVKRWSEE